MRSLALALLVLACGCDDDDVTGADAGPAPLSPTLLATDVRPGDEFGGAVAVGGATLAIGAPGVDAEGSETGRVYLYDAADLSPGAILESPGGDVGDRFGAALAFDATGDRLAVGAPGASGAATLSGVVYVFSRDGDGWRSDAVVEGTARGARFGDALAFAGSRLVVGASHESDGGRHAGGVFVFEESDGAWTPIALP